MFNVARRAANGLIDIVLPPVCAGCGLGGAWLCPRCAELVVPTDQNEACQRCGALLGFSAHTCGRCAGWPPELEQVQSVYPYQDAIRTMIHRLKYGSEPARASWCASVMVSYLTEIGWGADVLVPVPLHRSKLRSRGYNQSLLITRHVARQLDIPMQDALVRVRHTQSQVDLDADERRENVRGAFVARRQLHNATVLLIDDVATTGSTLIECAIACRQAGAASVRAMTVARAVAD